MSESQYDPGAALKAAREAIRVSPREIADELNLPVAVVEAIENNDTEKLPAPVYTRGYIRAYAKLLELDPDPIVIGYDFAEPLPTPAPEGRFERVQPLLEMKQIAILAGAALIVVALVVLLVVWLWPGEDEGVDAAGGGLPAETVPVATEQTNATPTTSADREGPMRETATLVVDEILAEPIAEPLGEAFTIADPGISTINPANGRRITEFGDDEMWFQFTEDCWVEIKDTQGANLYSDLSRAGQDLRLVGQGPFRILLGFAPGAQMEYNGERVSLMAHTRNNVASLVLGQ